MKAYQTNGDSQLHPVPIQEGEGIKIRVTRLLPCQSDIRRFTGENYGGTPFIVGHNAIGVISEDYPDYQLRLGQKVILNPYIERNIDREREHMSVWTRGIDTDGFFADYVVLPLDKVVLFPESVEEEEAIFTCDIATALTALHQYEHETGSYIAIIGSNAQCNILAQLCRYMRFVPIMIGTNELELQFATEKGIYYTVDISKENAVDRMREITGGKMADLVVFQTTALTIPYANTALSLAGEKSRVLLLSEDKSEKKIDCDLSVVLRKNLLIEGITSGAGEFTSAINILVQKALDLEHFIDKYFEEKDAEICFRDLAENPERYFAPVISF